MSIMISSLFGWFIGLFISPSYSFLILLLVSVFVLASIVFRNPAFIILLIGLAFIMAVWIFVPPFLNNLMEWMTEWITNNGYNGWLLAIIIPLLVVSIFIYYKLSFDVQDK